MDILPNEVGSHETYYYATDSHTEVATLQNSASIDTMLIIIYYPVWVSHAIGHRMHV